MAWIFTEDVLTTEREAHERIRGHFRSNGLIEGRDLTVEFLRYETGADFATLADRITGAAVVVASFGIFVEPVRDRFPGMPIVFYNLRADPVTVGLVASMRRPGGNITGTVVGGEDVVIKRWEMLKAFVPGMKRGGQLATRELAEASDKRAREGVDARKKYEDAVRASVKTALGIELVDVVVPAEASTEEIVEAVRKSGAEALTYSYPFNRAWRAFLKRANIPVMARSFHQVRNGALIGQSFNAFEGEAHATTMVKRILGGESPAVIPVYGNRNILFAVNRRVAREMGIEIPPAVLMRVNEVYD